MVAGPCVWTLDVWQIHRPVLNNKAAAKIKGMRVVLSICNYSWNSFFWYLVGLTNLARRLRSD